MGKKVIKKVTKKVTLYGFAKARTMVETITEKGFLTMKEKLMKLGIKGTPGVDVKPFKLWVEVGRIVKKGQKAIKGTNLFHISQTEELK